MSPEASQGSGSRALRPRARLIGLIGEDLISDEPVAVVELVKNAYDADASLVTIEFQGDPIDKLVVLDDGIGMDLDTVLGSWFEPGTVAKRRATTSAGGRPFQGAKGIGRFAAARLARSMLLESNSGTDEGVVVLVDWGRFDEDSYLDEIFVDYEIATTPGLIRGTRLTLEGLRMPWDEPEFARLNSRLSRLISPFEEVADFEIRMAIPGHPALSGRVRAPDLVLRPKYELVGHIDEDAKFHGVFNVDGELRKPFPTWPVKQRKGPVESGPFSVAIRAWDRDRDGLAPFAESLSTSLTEIRRTLDEYCGVSIYRNGFRVHPYGERGNDWLGLDIRSRLNPVTRLANNQIVAAIQISRDENPDLRDRSNREGMILNSAHVALADWFIEILGILEEERYRLRPRREEPAQADSLFEAFDVRPAFERARSELGAKHPLTKMLADSDRSIREGVERVQAAFSRLLMAAGLGQMVDVVLHEIGAPLGKVNRQLVLLERELKADEAESAKPRRMIASIHSWLEQIQALRQRLEPQTAGRRGRATTFDVVEEVQDDFNLYEALLAKQKIRYEIRGADRLRATMSRAALSQIVVNLLDNSIFWLSREHGSSGGGRIDVEIVPIEGGFSIRFSDDGPGILTQDRPHIFEPYFTKKPNGIGLGLYIARFLMEPYGRLQYGEECRLGGACFEASFERGVGL